MSHPVGTYLGGIRSVEDLRLRSRICEESGCWRYGLAVSDNGAELSVLVEGERLRCRGRAAAVMMKTQKRLPKGHVAFRTRNCEHHDCVNPDHARSAPKAQHGQYLTSIGIMRTAKSASANRNNGRASGKLSMEIGREIRQMKMTKALIAELASRYGVSERTIRETHAGRRWADPAPVAGSSIFNFAMAA